LIGLSFNPAGARKRRAGKFSNLLNLGPENAYGYPAEAASMNWPK
jgi:hypothetical protein